MDSEAERLLREADAHPFRGWDFSFLDGRVSGGETSWRYERVIRERLAFPVLDIGTGGGELFSTLGPFTGVAVAMESWAPNVPIAASRLRGVGGQVVWAHPGPNNDQWAGVGGELPFADESFALVLNRHSSFSPSEVFRVLQPGGVFMTQQVGGRDDEELRVLYGSFEEPVCWGAEGWRRHVADVGFEVVDAREEFPAKVFRDIGAVAWYLKAITDYFPGFTIDASEALLDRIWETIQTEGGLLVHDHRYFVDAQRAL